MVGNMRPFVWARMCFLANEVACTDGGALSGRGVDLPLESAGEFGPFDVDDGVSASSVTVKSDLHGFLALGSTICGVEASAELASKYDSEAILRRLSLMVVEKRCDF